MCPCSSSWTAEAASPLFGLLIFDCDGVLVDSERHATRIDVALLAGYGIPIDEAEYVRRFTGIRHVDMVRELERETGVILPADHLPRVRAELRAALTELGPALAVPGIHAALDGLGDRPRCVASGSTPEQLRHMLDQAGLWRHFAPHVFSSTLLDHGKPAPDVFLHAAAALGVPAGRSLVIEDSVPGVVAGRAAGMTVIGFTGTARAADRRPERLRAAGADCLLDRMADLPALVARLEAGG